MKIISTTFMMLWAWYVVAQPTAADRILESLVSDKGITGAAGAYYKGDSLRWEGAAGFADREANQAFLVHTPNRLASIAKPMTALAVMQLVEKGLIDLDEPIQTYVPEYPKQKKTQITTRHLLSHTSGIRGYKGSKETETKKEYPTLTDALEIFQDSKLLFEPGTQYSYTSYGYTVLGVIIEAVSGMTYEQYMRENIWQPAGMENTGVVKYQQPVLGQSVLYQMNSKGNVRVGPENNLSNRVPGGGIYATVPDMIKFGVAVLDHKLVKASTLDLMRAHHSLEKEANAYGFGWFLYYPKPDEGKIIGHGGEQTGTASHLFIVPETREVMVIISNTSGALKFVGPACFDIMSALNQ